MPNNLWLLQFNRESDSKRKQQAEIVEQFMMNKTFSCRNVAQLDCEIKMTLYLEFWLLLCSREKSSFRNVYVSMLVGTKQVIQEIPIRNAVLRLYCKINGKRQIFKICKRISRSRSTTWL